VLLLLLLFLLQEFIRVSALFTGGFIKEPIMSAEVVQLDEKYFLEIEKEINLLILKRHHNSFYIN
jgi:hypothetical protein